jgi:hypothetical protein
MEHAAGTRLKCEVCGAEAIVVLPADTDLRCCDRPLVPTFVPPRRD